MSRALLALGGVVALFAALAWSLVAPHAHPAYGLSAGGVYVLCCALAAWHLIAGACLMVSALKV